MKAPNERPVSVLDVRREKPADLATVPTANLFALRDELLQQLDEELRFSHRDLVLAQANCDIALRARRLVRYSAEIDRLSRQFVAVVSELDRRTGGAA